MRAKCKNILLSKSLETPKSRKQILNTIPAFETQCVRIFLNPAFRICSANLDYQKHNFEMILLTSTNSLFLGIYTCNMFFIFRSTSSCIDQSKFLSETIHLLQKPWLAIFSCYIIYLNKCRYIFCLHIYRYKCL